MRVSMLGRTRPLAARVPSAGRIPPRLARRDHRVLFLLRCTVPIVIACSACQGKIGVAEEHLGKSIRCPKCNGVIKAVAPEPTTAAALVGPAKPPARTAA